MINSVQDRTSEFRSVLLQVQKRQTSSKISSQRQSLLTNEQRQEENGSASRKGARTEFARRAADIRREITGTMAKLEKLAQCKCK